MLNTVWCPYRYVPGTIEYPLFVAGYLFSNENLEPENLAVEFARMFWGLTGTMAKDVGLAMRTLHEVAPERQEYTRIVHGVSLSRAADDFSRADEHVCRERLSKFPEIERILTSATKAVNLNRERMLDYRAAAEVLSGLYKFGASGRTRDPGWKKIRKTLREAWRRSRWCDGPHYLGKNRLRNDYAYYGFTGAILRDLNRLAED
jgi:hypothetical protein